MAHLARSKASLRIFGDDLNPEEVTNLLGCIPTKAWHKGHIQTGTSGRGITRKSGSWHLHAGDAEPENLDGQVSELLEKLTSNLAVWAGLSQRFELDLFCGWFVKESNEGVSISPATMLALAERGIELSLDIYGPDEPQSETEPAQPSPPADVPASVASPLQPGRS